MTPPHIARAVEGRRMPWKNGGGETIELLVHPAGADMDAFDWRISLARVAADGPFSAFPGVDRTLTILDGEGLELSVGAGAPMRLTPASAPFAFPADAACTGRLLAGPVTDLNVMTRRGRFAHHVDSLVLAGPTRLASHVGTAVVFCRDGEVALAGAAMAGVIPSRMMGVLPHHPAHPHGKEKVSCVGEPTPLTLGRHDAVVLAGGEALEVAPRGGAASVLTIVIRPA